MDKHVLIIGGGVAGLEAGCRLAQSGYSVSLYEKDRKGGHINDWFRLFPDRRDSMEVMHYFEKLITESGLKITSGESVDRISEDKRKFLAHTVSGKEISADAVVIATGFDLFKSSRKEEYGYGIYDNVISSADLELMFRQGKIKKTDGTSPKKIGIIHCVGSRDEKVGNLYCSKLCCVTAVKQAIEIKEHDTGCKVFCFYMDMRMGGAHYEELYREAQEQWGVNFIRGKVSEVSESVKGALVTKVEDTLLGRPLRMELDMLVLMAGMEMSEAGKKLAAASGLETGENRFFRSADNHYGSNRSNKEGIFYAGTCTMPMNVTETISHARAVVPEVINYLNGRSQS
ncbi:MAG TPA: FAD-dependent oxidoreductase [Bacteroidales bacterium]|nr:FAD-dependent oxidoreductase [Bacteroidales bacterium]